MKPAKIETIDRYQEIVSRYGSRGCFSNDFIQREASNMINHDALFEYCGEKNAFLLVKVNRPKWCITWKVVALLGT